MGVLTEVDMAAFAAYCQFYARWKEAQELITSGGSTFETDKGYQQQTPWVGIANTNQKLMLQQAASEFGLTPSSRSRRLDFIQLLSRSLFLGGFRLIKIHLQAYWIDMDLLRSVPPDIACRKLRYS